MKRVFIAAAALFLTIGATQAQTANNDNAATRKHHRGAYSHRHGGMSQLNLSEDQKKQFKSLGESYHKQFADLRSNKSLSADELKTKSKALRKEQFDKMQSLLTPEQKAKWAEQRKNFKGKGKGKGFVRGKGLEQMKSKLGLTDEQTAKLKANREGFHDKAKAIRSNASLSSDQKKEQMKALMKEQRESMKSIFTAEQLEKMKSARKARSNSGSI